MRRSRMVVIVATLPMAVLAMGGESSAFEVDQPPSDEIPDNWRRIEDETGEISIAVPPTWSTIDVIPDGSGQPWISATTDESLFFPPEGTADTYSVPGTIYRAFFVAADPVAWLQTSPYYDFCTSELMQPFENDAFVGYVQQFSRCGGTASVITQVAASRRDNAEFSVFLHVQLVGAPDDSETLEHLLRSMS